MKPGLSRFFFNARMRTRSPLASEAYLIASGYPSRPTGELFNHNEHNGVFHNGHNCVCFVFPFEVHNGGEPLAHRDSRRLSSRPHSPEASECESVLEEHLVFISTAHARAGRCGSFHPY